MALPKRTSGVASAAPAASASAAGGVLTHSRLRSSWLVLVYNVAFDDGVADGKLVDQLGIDHDEMVATNERRRELPSKKVSKVNLGCRT